MLRALLTALGWLALGLGIAGIPLPILPTTPFLLLAAACFVRSSPRLHRRLVEHRRLGPYLSQWRDDRSVPPGAKLRAHALVLVSFGVSIALVEQVSLRILLLVLGVALLVFLARLRTAPPPKPRRLDPDPAD